MKEFTVVNTPNGLLLKQPITGAHAELLQTPGGRAKPPFTIRLSLPSVFGRSKMVTIGTDWVQIGDRIFRAEKTGKR